MRLPFIVAMALSLFPCLPCTADAHRVALVIGIGTYDKSTGLDSLAADNDTTRIASVLSNGGWTVHLMNSYGALPTLPNRSNIMRALGVDEAPTGNSYGSSDVSFLGLDSLTPDDTLMFFYGGHGLTGEDQVDYIMPKDSSKDQDGIFAKSSLIGVPVIETALRKTGAGTIIIVTDACRDINPTRDSQSTIRWTSRSASASPTLGKIYDPQGKIQHVFILRSSSPDQVSYEMREQNSGVFSYYFAQALSPKGGGDRPSGSAKCLTLDSLYHFTQSQTVRYVQGTLQHQQTPYIQADDLQWPSEFCVLTSQVEKQPVPEPAPAPTPPQLDRTALMQACIDQDVQSCIQDCVVNYHIDIDKCRKKKCSYQPVKGEPVKGQNYVNWTQDCNNKVEYQLEHHRR